MEDCTWMGGWLQVKAILVARNINLTVTRKGGGEQCEATMYNLADTQASCTSEMAALPSLKELGLRPLIPPPLPVCSPSRLA